MKKLVLLSCMCMCIVSTSVNAENPGDCIEFMGVNGRIYCYSSGSVRPFRNAFSYCHALGYHQATTNELCDISSEPSERLARNDGNGPSGGCKNLVGVAIPDNLYWTAGLFNDTWNDSLGIEMSAAYPTNSNPSYSGRHAICVMGKWECPEGMYYDETEQRCRDLFCSYNYTAGDLGTNESNCYYDYVPGNSDNVQYDCSYTYTESSNSASISSSKSRGGCKKNYYCALHWANEGCTTEMTGGSGTSATIYGVCTPKNDYYIMCPKDRTLPQITRVQGCGADEYCALHWSDESCSTEMSENTGRIYGVCSPKDDYYIMCLKDNTPASVTENKGCSEDKYCFLAYKTMTCSELDNEQETFYGVCLPFNEASATCPVQ